MLKVKRPVTSKNSTAQIDEWENDIKKINQIVVHTKQK